MPTPDWDEAPIGRWFASRYPGKNCRDWPQHIPDAMAVGRGLCCFQEVTDGDMG